MGHFCLRSLCSNKMGFNLNDCFFIKGVQRVSSVIRLFQDNVEYFTVEITGESGMSISGLARICGVSSQAVQQLLASIDKQTIRADTLKRFVAKKLWIEVDGVEVRGSDNNRVVKDRVCAAVIDYYAFESTSISDEQKAQAIFAHRAFGEIGVRSWIQSITGWNNKKPDFQITDFVMNTPAIWDRETKAFPTEFYEQIYRLRGWDYHDPNRKGHPGIVGSDTNKLIYDKFPQGVAGSLSEKYAKVNKRRRKYEFLTLEDGRNHLEKHMVAVLITMRLSPAGNWKKFLKNLNKAIPDANAIRFIQLEFSFLSELEDDEDNEDDD